MDVQSLQCIPWPSADIWQFQYGDDAGQVGRSCMHLEVDDGGV